MKRKSSYLSVNFTIENDLQKVDLMTDNFYKYFKSINLRNHASRKITSTVSLLLSMYRAEESLQFLSISMNSFHGFPATLQHSS